MLVCWSWARVCGSVPSMAGDLQDDRAGRPGRPARPGRRGRRRRCPAGGGGGSRRARRPPRAAGARRRAGPVPPRWRKASCRETMRGQRPRLLGEAVAGSRRARVLAALPPLEVVLGQQAGGVGVGRGVGRPAPRRSSGVRATSSQPGPLFGQELPAFGPGGGETARLVADRGRVRGASPSSGALREQVRGDALVVVPRGVRPAGAVARVDAQVVVVGVAVRGHACALDPAFTGLRRGFLPPVGRR